MTVEFALFLSPEGIALAHRQPAGHWALIDEAPLDGDDLDAGMAALKSAATARGGAEAPVLLVLPDDQVLYTSFMAPTDDVAQVEARITEGLDGMTPYPVSDLSYDWRPIEEDRVKVAVVAKETLGEATEFAAAHGFKAAGFAAMPPAERFPAMPLFGEARNDRGLDGSGMAFGSDDWVEPEPPAKEPEPEAAPEDKTAEAEATEDATKAKAEAKPEPEAKPAPDANPEADPDANPEPGPETGEAPAPPPVPAPAKAAKPDAIPPGAKASEPDAGETPEPDETHPPAGETVAQDTPPHDTAGEEDTLTPIADPTLDHPIAPLAPEDEDQPEAPPVAPPRPQARMEPEPEPEPDPQPEPAQATAPEPDPTPDPTPTREAMQASEPPSAPTATRGKVDGAPARPLTADKPTELPPRPTRAMGTPGATAPTAPEDEGDTTSTPAFGFAARRGKAAKPESTAGELVSTRRSRLGFGAAEGAETGPVLHPDAAPAMAATPASPARPGNRLAAQLARVRDASKARPQAPATPPAPDRRTEHAPAFGTAPATPRETAPEDTSAFDEAGRGFGFSRRRGTPPPPSPSRSANGDNAFTSGLLARKPAEQSGPSFRTGLILTVVLLILLAVIAVWSALFLPDSPMARLFLGGSDSETASAEGASFTAPPTAVTAPPAFGALDVGAVELQGPPRTPEAAPVEEPPEPEVETAAVVAAPEPEADPEPEVAAGTTTGREAATPEEVLAEALAIAQGTLPDIDADLDLPPLPPLPEEMLPSLEETERIYAEDGIWPRTPERPTISALSNVNDVYIASIDPDVPTVDAIAMAAPGVNIAEQLRRVPPPPPFGVTPDRDARGLVQPTPEGVLTPEGAFVVSGAPPVAAIPRPREIEPSEAPTPQIDADEAILGTFAPQPRPADLEETRERQVLGGFSSSELAGLRPDPRPLSAQEAAARASLFPQGAPTLDADAAAETADAAPPAPEIAGTRLAIPASRVPPVRPSNIAAIVAAAAEAPAPAVAPESIARAPSIPANADVTRAATERNAIRLREVNLIGVTGAPSDRRALVRLPSGRFVRVGVGDRLDGGRVAAIGEASLQYVRNGRNVTLEIPG